MSSDEKKKAVQARRGSLWERLAGGMRRTSEYDLKGIRAMNAEGFAPAGAKYDDNFGNSALYETAFNAPKRSDAQKIERINLAEDALRQMS